MIRKVTVHSRGKYVRFRVREPTAFKTGTLRTHDVGRKGHSKRIAGRLKTSGKWATQAFLVAKRDFAQPTPAVKRLLVKIV